MSVVLVCKSLALCLLVSLCNAAHYGHVMVPLAHRQEGMALLSFSNSWQVLGPFQIGTREATWGADPLEYLGGFGALHYDPKALFQSSLPANGTAAWSIAQATQTTASPASANASLSIGYSNVDWDFLKIVYGWAAVQYQAWARGQLIVGGNSTVPVILYTDAILEYWIDDVHYFGGDFFTFRKAPPVIHLSPGVHKIDIRLVRDVRAFGGILAPTIDVLLHAERASGTLELSKPGILISDVVDGRLATPVGSVFLRNSGDEDITVLGIQSSDVRCPLSLQDQGLQKPLTQGPSHLTAEQAQHPSSNNTFSTVIVAGQTRPVSFNVSLPANNVSTVQYDITYKGTSSSNISTLTVSQKLTKTSTYEPHKIVFLHPGGMASYAMLRPPAKNATCASGQNSSLPVLMGLHGAGLEADNGIVARALDPVPDLCAWVVFPTGVTPWSGDDWHNWGFADVEAAVSSIPGWIKHVGWQGPGVDLNRWIVTGHSNGGQGTWYALTHRPDKVLAAAPLSGYSSIQKYVPYELWQPTDPRRTAVVSGSLNSYRHEMLMQNPRGIPIQQQHGQLDDNVPAYNSRLLFQQLFLSSTNSSYNEVVGQNHWWDTVMTTPQLVEFYYSQAKSNDKIPRRLDEFEFVVADPGDMGSKGGIKVLLLEDPGQYGRVRVKGHVITTSNVLSLDFNPAVFRGQTITIDGSDTSLNDLFEKRDSTSAVTLTKIDGKWSSGSLNIREEEPAKRSGRQLGSMTAILRTHGAFDIRHQGLNITSHIALQVSRNLHQYFQADANIVNSRSWDRIANTTGNVITIAIGDNIPPSILPEFPLQVRSSGVTIRDFKASTHQYSTKDTSLGAAFLRPLEGERLELLLWGSDSSGLSRAARLVPMVTGVGQPDFVVLGESAKWKGVDGALALGFFDHEWKVSPSSVVS